MIELQQNNIKEFQKVIEDFKKQFVLYPARTKEAWFEYYGDPSKKPTYIQKWLYEIDNIKGGKEEVKKHLRQYKATQQKELEDILKEEEDKTISDILYEKEIEELLVNKPKLIEPSFEIIDNGRQYQTEIGRIDILGKSNSNDFVVVEIKRGEANDRVIGQILRYIGWVKQNLCVDGDKVRGIIMAGGFPDKVKYARLGLLKSDHESFLKFKFHPLVDKAF